MAGARFVMSTGRASTQYLAKTLQVCAPDAVVEHEALGPNYFSRRVFRNGKRFAPVLGNNVPIQRKFIEIEDLVKQGRDYIDVGWPAFGWLPYLGTRFGSAFGFVHLVRNPFNVAASLTTHGLFGPNAHRGFQRRAMIHGEDAHILHKDLAEAYSEYSPFERNLFHWLEVNSFVCEHHGNRGYLGLFKFEDLYGSDHSRLSELLSVLASQEITNFDRSPYDHVHKKLDTTLTCLNVRLRDRVIGFATSLGYSEEELTAAANLEDLSERYSHQRLSWITKG